MGTVSDYLNLIRIRQWYKNLVVYLAIFFSGNILSFNLLFKSTLGFLSLCLISSANYILNDIIDVKSDRQHPEKRFRPIANGRIGIFSALVMVVLLVIASIEIAYFLDLYFLLSVVLIFSISQLYTLFLKKELFADILAIAINFVLRAVSGAFIIHVYISPWLILCPFFLSLFLSVSKRRSEMFIKKNNYSPELTNALMLISTTTLIISYSLYSFLSQQNKLLITLPFVLYGIFRFLYLVYSGSIIARQAERFWTDTRLVFSICLWGLVTLIILYF